MSRKIGLGLCCLVFLLAAGSRAYSQSRIVKDLKLDPGGRLVVEASASDVIVTGRPESGAHVVITSNRADLEDLFTFRFDEEPGAVRIEVRKRSVQPWPKSLQVRMEVEVPTKTSVEIRTGGGDTKVSHLEGNTNLETSGGDVAVSDLAGNLAATTSGGDFILHDRTGGGDVKVSHLEGDTNLETSGGDVAVSDLAGSLTATTSGGDFQLHDLTGEVKVRTSGGDITLENAGGRVEAHTWGGDVNVAFARGNAKGGEVETSGGDIKVRVDPAVSLNLDASASSGEVTSDLPLKVTGGISPSRLHATLGSGGQTLRVHTNGGSVHLSAL